MISVLFWWTIIHRRTLFKKNSLSMLILGQKSCILGPTIFEIPRPNWHSEWGSRVWDERNIYATNLREVRLLLGKFFLDTSAVIRETEKINGRFFSTQTLVVGIGRLGITLCIMVDSRGSAYSKIVAVSTIRSTNWEK